MTVIQNPLPISCTTCHQAMRVEFQELISDTDELLIAAECSCGRVLGVITSERLFAQRHNSRPFIREDIAAVPDVGERGKAAIELAHERIARAERWIAAATWAREGKRT